MFNFGFTRVLRSALAIGSVSVLLASPVFAQVPILFGVDAKAVDRASGLGLPVHYGSAWAGAWNQKWGWNGVEQDLRKAFAAGVIPVVHWWYWGDDISPTCVENGCQDRYHGVQKDKATWARLSNELVALILREGGSRAQAIVVLETEFNKNGIETHEPFDGYIVEQAAIFQRAGFKVVLGFGDWGAEHWGNFDRAIAAVDMLGTTALRSSLRDQGRYYGVAEDLVASVRHFHTRFQKPTFITDLALSSYPAPDYETHQAAVIKDIFGRLDELKSLGVVGLVWRMLADDPAFDTNNYHGVAERHWGFLRADGSQKPSYAALYDGWLKESLVRPIAPPPPPPVVVVPPPVVVVPPPVVVVPPPVVVVPPPVVVVPPPVVVVPPPVVVVPPPVVVVPPPVALPPPVVVPPGKLKPGANLWKPKVGKGGGNGGGGGE